VAVDVCRGDEPRDLVAEIRRALRDSPSNPKFVRTVYGFGYRFIGQATVDAGAVRAERGASCPWLIYDRREISLMEDTNVIGRGPDSAIQIDSPGISRQHARILVAHGEATLEDLGSKNGTHVNGARISASRRLSDGDEVRLGTVVLRFRIASTTSPTASIPSERA
jgi:hypothetical protein